MIPARPTVSDVLQALGVQTPSGGFEEPTPWYVHVLMGVAAWTSALLFALFFVLAGLYQLVEPMVLGALLVLLAVAVRRSPVGPIPFVAQLSLAAMLCGEIVILGGGVEAFGIDDPWVLGLLVFGGGLVAFPDPVHRFIAASVVLGMIEGLLAEPVGIGVTALALPFFGAAVAGFHWEARLERGAAHGVRVPVALASLLHTWGLLLALAMAEPSNAWGLEMGITLGMAGIVGVWLVGGVLPEVGATDPVPAAIVTIGIGALGALTYQMPGVLPAFATMLLGFHRRNSVLLGIGTLAFGGFLGWTYYDLDVGLDLKAVILAASGGLLWGLRAALRMVEAR